MTEQDAIASTLRSQMAINDYNMSDVQKKSGVGYSHIHGVSKGTQNTSINTLIKIINTLNINFFDFMNEARRLYKRSNKKD
jgi:DNA-binding phage protein